MRVRLTLEEKRLPWASHLLDIMKGEHLTDEYISINPNAVVPTLVDDGWVIIDSTDIVDYLDKKYVPNSLRPSSSSETGEMYEWMHLARDNHISIKTYMYGNIGFLTSMKKSEEEMEWYRQRQTFDKELLAFHERFSSMDGITSEQVKEAEAVIDSCFAQMNKRLENNAWLAGNSFSLADIAWIPQLVILKAAKYPFENYPNLEAWKKSIMQRPSFKAAILDWLPKTEMNFDKVS